MSCCEVGEFEGSAVTHSRDVGSGVYDQKLNCLQIKLGSRFMDYGTVNHCSVRPQSLNENMGISTLFVCVAKIIGILYSKTKYQRAATVVLKPDCAHCWLLNLRLSYHLLHERL